MKKILVIVLCLCLLTACASAEVVGTVDNLYEEKICRYVAPNGQELYYVSMEAEPSVKMEDVNFDGVEDIVILTTLGASNARFVFFVWDNGQYTMVKHDLSAPKGLYNYELYPELGLVAVSVNNGLAGALNEKAILRWDGTQLMTMRYAVAAEDTQTTFDNNIMTTVTNSDVVCMSVYEVTYAADGRMDTLLWEQLVDMAELDDASRLEEEDVMLWQGLR